MKESLIHIIKEAGKEILHVSNSSFFEIKEDSSPVTKADKASHNYLKTSLRAVYNVPVISEEEISSFEVRSQWKEFWLIDPLDGTKEFIKGYDDYCINIALIKDRQPIVGIIYAPKLNELYYAEKGCGFEYRGNKHQQSKNRPVVAISRFHHSESTQRFMQFNNLVYTNTIGAAIKFGRMALGLIDIYPRFEGSKEWDIAAGQVILEENGCAIIDLKTREKPLYNKENIQNNHFLAVRDTVDHMKFEYGDLL